MFVYPAHRQHVEERCESADKSATDLNKLLSLSQLNSQQSKHIGYTFRGVMQTRKRSEDNERNEGLNKSFSITARAGVLSPLTNLHQWAKT